MKVDFTAEIKTLDGVAMFEENDGEKVNITLRKVVLNALTAMFEDEKNLSGDEKMKRWELARKIHGGNNEVTAEDVTLIKKLVAKAFGVGIVGPAFTLLEGGE